MTIVSVLIAWALVSIIVTAVLCALCSINPREDSADDR